MGAIFVWPIGRGSAVLFAAFAAVAFLVVIAAPSTWAADYYADPAFEGKSSGTKDAPFSSAQQALESGVLKDEDRLLLASGSHGTLTIRSMRNKKMITIEALPDHEPKFDRIVIEDSAYWRLSGLHVSPAYGMPYGRKGVMAVIAGGSEYVVLENSVLRSTTDSSGWSVQDWADKAANAIEAQGKRITIRNNRLENVRVGISANVDYGLIEGNIVDRFTADAMQGLGDYTAYRNNRITNCLDVNDSENDGFHAWSVDEDQTVGGGKVIGSVLSGNRFIYRTEDSIAFPCSLRAVALGPGRFEDWTLANNLIVTDHGNGLGVQGANGVRILHNTVFNPVKRQGTRIVVTEHRDGAEPQDIFILSNIAPRIRAPQTQEVVIAGNIGTDFAEAIFADLEQQDFHLKDEAGLAVDNGATAAFLATITTKTMPDLPQTDIDGVKRPQGAGFDVGAYERKRENRSARGYLPVLESVRP